MILATLRKFIAGCHPRPVAWWELLVMRSLFARIGFLALPIIFHILVRAMTSHNFRCLMAELLIFLILPLFISFITNRRIQNA